MPSLVEAVVLVGPAEPEELVGLARGFALTCCDSLRALASSLASVVPTGPVFSFEFEMLSLADLLEVFVAVTVAEAEAEAVAAEDSIRALSLSMTSTAVTMGNGSNELKTL